MNTIWVFQPHFISNLRELYIKSLNKAIIKDSYLIYNETLDIVIKEIEKELNFYNIIPNNIMIKKNNTTFIIKTNDIEYKDKWIKYTGEKQPVADDITIAYSFCQNGHLIKKDLAKNIDWTTTENGGINFYKIIKVGETRPDSNGWVKYDGKGKPFLDMNLDIKDIYRHTTFNIPSNKIDWEYITHYRISKPQKTFAKFINNKYNIPENQIHKLLKDISEYLDEYLKEI